MAGVALMTSSAIVLNSAPNNVHVTQFVAGNVVSQGAHAGTVTLCDASSHQGRVVQAVEKSGG
jgi:hypothetical protein